MHHCMHLCFALSISTPWAERRHPLKVETILQCGQTHSSSPLQALQPHRTFSVDGSALRQFLAISPRVALDGNLATLARNTDAQGEVVAMLSMSSTQPTQGDDVNVTVAAANLEFASEIADDLVSLCSEH
eukprot:CAMPEP_0175844606 /NCGR_PEP_ID=MMETSP0107_2-20121207/21734_1 /TAXON_ID=195067 ORGANISM="Goniomonas pacifica, Strain CCMP1869" /NCGR_SAMPLE_ID=MMETSP0107_2 /ASSEMBLY_ACC=CAM_ASM_000203 /LENGTH=129 /DNA_ID=CAMNT_0017159015 /DNA_START=93 /DNA_END=482 /DNA_ORIENTATION=+